MANTTEEINLCDGEPSSQQIVQQQPPFSGNNGKYLYEKETEPSEFECECHKTFEFLF